MKQFTHNSLNQLDNIEAMIMQKSKDNDYFQSSLKDELEVISGSLLKTTHEHLQLIKSITETIKHMKD